MQVLEHMKRSRAFLIEQFDVVAIVIDCFGGPLAGPELAATPVFRRKLSEKNWKSHALASSYQCWAACSSSRRRQLPRHRTVYHVVEGVRVARD
jgi:hypothetical protein